MMADLGFMGMMVDPKYGGSGLDSIYVVAMTEIANRCICCRSCQIIRCMQVLKSIAMKSKKMKYLVPLAKGKL
jgi:alkylation response protein AidB-like acyl-CoA dehydrogenase